MIDSAPDRAAFLRNSLRANAAFSTLSGVLFALAGAPIADFLGVAPPLLVTFVGLNLLGFAAALVWLASRPALPVRLAVIVIGADLAWVAGTLLLVFAEAFTRAGATAALAVANVVLVFAVLQTIGVRRLGAARAPA
ncbi:MAG: hypothetical protein QNK03_20690 [Myxococcota bacterium]|nr:hypothetical protein [Myxococcota bacterium]